MARMEHEAEIGLLLADLGLDGNTITWKFYNRSYVAATRTGKTTGRCSPSPQAATIEIALRQERAALLNTYAHELRHYWHRVHDIYGFDHFKGEGWRSYWKGTPFVPRPQRWVKLPYGERPDEADCRAYARDAVRRLFGADSVVAETKQEHVQFMFRAAMSK
jgi:hypothetical protein